MSLDDLDTTELSIDFSNGDVLDERVARLTKLETLVLADCPPDLVLPDALLELPKLARLAIRRGTPPVRLPALIERLPLVMLDLDNPQLEGARLPPTLRELVLWTTDPERDLRLLGALRPALRSLDLNGEQRVATLIPPELGELTTLETLELSGLGEAELPAELARLTELRTLVLSTVDPARDVRALAARLPRLRSLALRSNTEQPVTLPDELGAFGELVHLALQCPIGALPASIAQLGALRSLHLGGLPAAVIPEVVCELANLETLRVTCRLNGLSASLAKLTRLRELDLSSALNKGVLLGSFGDTTLLKPLPKVLGELVSLEKLGLDQCGVFDAAPLRPLARLRELSVTWSGLTTFEDLGALTSLEVLDVEYAAQVRDFAPLGRLTKLRRLGLVNTRPRSLDVLRALPDLAVLDITSIRCKGLAAVYELDVTLTASDEVMEKYAQRATLRALPPIAAIAAELASDERAVVEVALANLATWTEASSSRGDNAIAVALGLAAAAAAAAADDDHDEDDDDRDSGHLISAGPRPDRQALPPLDACLDRHLERIDPAILARLFQVLFQSTSDDFRAAVRVAREVARRGDDAAQLALVEGFEQANRYYDPGHRMWSATTHDLVIEDVLPELGGAALARLVVWCSDGHLDDDADGMAPLVAPALDRAGDSDLPKVLARLEAYVTALASRGAGQTEQMWRHLEALASPAARTGVAEVKQRLDAILAGAREREALEADLKSGEAARVTHALVATAAWDDEALGELQGAFWNANTCTGLDAEALALLIAGWKLLGHDLGLAEAIGLAVEAGEAIGRAAAAPLALADTALASLLRTAIVAQLVDRRRSAVRLARLRAWANQLEGLTDAEGEHRDLAGLLARASGQFDMAKLKPALAALFACDGFVPPPGFAAGPTPSRLAADIGQLVTDPADWPTFCELARHLHKLQLTGRSLERILAQLLAVAIRARDPSAVRATLALVPAEVTWDILAYNLACHHAAAGDRPATLRWTTRSLELGKSPDQFVADSDFAAFAADSDFRALLDAAR